MTTAGEILATLIMRGDDANDIPHPIGSVVLVSGMGYLVAEMSYVNCGRQPATYGLRGHPDFGTEAYMRAWCNHEDTILVSMPTAQTWTMLREAVAIYERSRVMPTHG